MANWRQAFIRFDDCWPAKLVLQLLQIYKGNYSHTHAFEHLSKMLIIDFCSFRESIGKKVVASLLRKDLAVTYAAIDMLNSLMHSTSGEYNLKQEQLNKSSLLSSKQFLDNLLNTWLEHVNFGSGALVLSAMLDFLTYALCVPYSETTDSKQFDALLEMVASRGRAMFKLFQVGSRCLIYSNILLIIIGF